MKRIHTLIVLLGLAMGMMLTGCNKDESAGAGAAATNAAPAVPAAPSTNK